MPPHWSLVNTDAMDWLRSLESEHADGVCTDPPYGIDYRPFGGKSSSGPSAQCPIPSASPRFAAIANDDCPFVWWLREAWRVTKPGGCLLCFAGWQTSDTFREAIRWAGWKLRSMIVWDKERPGLGDFRQDFAPQHEIIWFAVKPAHSGGRMAGFRFQRCRESGKLDRPRSVLRCKTPPLRERTHPTEKPVELLTTLIRATVPAGGLVIDPFTGTGSTGVAALTEGRRFAGSELSPAYVATARARLTTAARSGPPASTPSQPPVNAP